VVALLTLIAAGAIGVVAYGLATKPSTSKGRTIHLPGLNQLKGLVSGPSNCPSRIYPAGAEYTFEKCTSSGTPIGWEKCSTVTYSVDAAGAPAGYAADVTAAIGELRSATGLKLVEVSKSADIGIGWDPSLYDPAPGTSGEAGVTDFEATTDLSGSRATSATVRLSSHLDSGTAPQVGEEPVLLHELGHSVGLGHYSGPVVMNPTDRGYAAYQPGDLAGLARLYQPASC
jgi:hypothetical protein